jgi:hypothetical protein
LGMQLHLHKQATTTPRVQAAIRASSEPASALAERYGATPQEAVAVMPSKTLLVSLADLLAVVREFLNPKVWRSGPDRYLYRHGRGKLRGLLPKSPRPAHKAFSA